MNNFAKALAAIIVITLPIAGYIYWQNQQPEPVPENEFITHNVPVEAELVSVAHQGYPEITFSVYLSRPDLNLNQSELHTDSMTLTADLPQALQPKYMYVSDKEDSFERICDRPRFPHACPLEKENFQGKNEAEFLLKVTFEDGGYGEATVLVPEPEKLDEPTIVEPTEAPEQGETFAMKFKDVDADSYYVEVALCREYENDGINPCLAGEQYNIVRVDGKLQFLEASEYSNPLLEVDGKIVTVSSNLELDYSDAIDYQVTAKAKLGNDKIPHNIESYSSTTFKVE